MGRALAVVAATIWIGAPAAAFAAAGWRGLALVAALWFVALLAAAAIYLSKLEV
jgi:hypothetical protein